MTFFHFDWWVSRYNFNASQTTKLMDAANEVDFENSRPFRVLLRAWFGLFLLFRFATG